MTDSRSATEGALIRAFRGGDPEALGPLFDRHLGVLRERIGRQIPARLSRRVSVADMLQEVRLVAFQRHGAFDGETQADFGRWLAGIADRRVRKAWQHHATTAKRSVTNEVSRDSSDTRRDVAPGYPTPSQDAIGREVSGLAARALDSLEPDHREVLRLVRFEGFELKQVAARMGRSYEAIYKLHARALLRLSEAFERLGGS